jgi:hypothetical protein
VAHNGVLTVAANNLDYLGKNKIKIKQAFGDMWTENKQQKTWNTKITHLFSGFGKEFVFEIEMGRFGKKKLEDWQKSAVIAACKCEITGMNGKKYSLDAELDITLLNPDDNEIESEESMHVTL